MKKILSVVCAYFPNNERLSTLVASLLVGGDVVVVNNGGEVKLNVPNNLGRFSVINPDRNLGTLASYNMVIEKNPEYSYYWLWNQDSEITTADVIEYVSKSMAAFHQDATTACVTLFDKKNFVSPFDRNLVLAKESTSIISRERIQKIVPDWFDENLFMDYGDWDFSYRLYRAGGRIRQIKGININHQLGDPENTVLGPMNRSSMMRLHMQGINTIYLFRKHGMLNFPSILLVARFFILPIKNILFKGSMQRNCKYLSGVASGIKGNLSSLYALELNKEIK